MLSRLKITGEIMRNFKKGIIALVAASALAVPAASAMAGTDSASTGSTALTAGCTGVVNVCDFSILDGSNNAIASGLNITAALVACPNVDVASLAVGEIAACASTQYPTAAFIQNKG
jgi:hypothetical protein